MKVIGFGCKAQVGKDTAVEYLEGKFFGRAKRVAFADGVKQVAKDLFGLSHAQCFGTKEDKETIDPRYGITSREILQGIGQKMREIVPDIWIDTVFQSVIPKLQQEGYDIFLISDVRYPNEGDKIHAYGGVVVRVDRAAGGTSVGSNHSSEVSMDDYQNFDFIVENNGSLEEYYKKLDRLMEEVDGREEGKHSR